MQLACGAAAVRVAGVVNAPRRPAGARWPEKPGVSVRRTAVKETGAPADTLREPHYL